MPRWKTPPTEAPLLGLMDQPAQVPFQPQSPSSIEAAVKVQPKAGTQRAIVLEYIQRRGDDGATDFEGMRDLKDKISSIENAYRARRQSLADDGLIVLANCKRINPSSRIDCDVWVAVTPRSRAAAARLAHNQQVEGSSPSSGTGLNDQPVSSRETRQRDGSDGVEPKAWV